MSLYKCKCCGGDLDVHDGDKIVTCEYCNSSQTIPNEKDEQKLKLYARGNLLRNEGEFDKAYTVFSQLLGDEIEDAETYWNILLCKYGITYVDDYDGKKKPTINRMSMSSILEDEDYKKVISLADVVSKENYETEAKIISDIQNNILKIVNNEKPYDIFISYKETDEFKERTRDSVLAQEIYDTLTKDGYRVFLSRVSLEKIIGKEYEPYIYSALYTSKIMLLVSTSIDYINSVWVKNEWSRFVDMMKNDKSKSLVPCYRDIDPYDLPKEIRNLQGLDMSKLGFIQDLKAGVEKILGHKQKKEDVKVNSNKKIIGGSVENIALSLIDRGFDFLLKDKIEIAKKMFNEALTYSEQAKAYLGLLCIKYNSSTIEELYSLHNDISHDPYFISAMKYANEEERELLENISKSLKDKKQKENESIYQEGLKLLEDCEFDKAIVEFKKIQSYKDSKDQINECIYGKAYENQYYGEENANISDYDEAIKIYKTILNYKDSKQQINACYYSKAELLFKAKKRTEAVNVINQISPDYKFIDEVKELKQEIAYTMAKEFGDAKKYESAIKVLDLISDYKDSKELKQKYISDLNKKIADEKEYNRKFTIYKNNCDIFIKNSNGDDIYDTSHNLKKKRRLLNSIIDFKNCKNLVDQIDEELSRRKRRAIIRRILILGVILGISYLIYNNIYIPKRNKALEQKAYEERIEAEFQTMQQKYGVPVIDLENYEVKYGLYPQTVIDDQTLIDNLNNLDSSNLHSNDYYFYNNEYYYKRVASPYKETYTYNNGNVIKNKTYWFKCEQVSWRIIDSTDDSLTLISNKLLNQCYYSKNSRYVNSAVRSWLNGTFYNQAFALNDSYILETVVDNSEDTVDSCGSKGYTDNTLDKVYLLSYQDIYTRKYKLSNNTSDPYNTSCKTTDYIRAVGVFCNQNDGFEYCGDYWTRSCCSSSNSPSCVNASDTMNHSVKSTYGACARPVIRISKTQTEDEKQQVIQQQENSNKLQEEIQAKIKEKFGTPILDLETNTVEYGYYPQSLVSDTTLIENLNKSSIYIENNYGYVYYNDEIYKKVLGSPYKDTYTFKNGETIVTNKHYWFKCESIKWRILESNDGEYKLISDILLDKQVYHKSNSKINYSISSIRTWLNETFYNKAFPDTSYIKSSQVDGNDDFVYLLSRDQYNNYFTNSTDLYCVASDYIRANSCYLDGEYGDYWTRTFYGPTYASMTYSAYYVTSRNNGKITVDSNNGISNTTNCVRPSITIKIPN